MKTTSHSKLLAPLLLLLLAGCGSREFGVAIDNDIDAGDDSALDAGTDAGRRNAQWTGGDPSCDPPCPSGTRCGVDPDRGILHCAHICNPPHGCELPEACDEDTRRCGAPVCNGVQCEQGQDCIDLETGNRNARRAVCTCVKYQLASDGGVLPDSDSCLGYGKVCDTASAGPANGEAWTRSECR